MKVREVGKKEFKPIILEVTFDSEAEMRELKAAIPHCSYNLWNWLDKYFKSEGRD